MMYFYNEVCSRYGYSIEYVDNQYLDPICDMVIASAIANAEGEEEQEVFADDVF